MAAVCRRLRFLGPATVRGRLYDLGAYPAAMLDGSNDSRIRGQLVEIDEESVWQELDRYESCPRPGEDDGLFRRVCTTATVSLGQTMDCWIYVYNRDLREAKVVESGCWRTHRGSTPR
jgi:gamma-glutamylcyclotransferase (GGCT)/AIG2-like uncharacterized protein YtfP